MVSTAANIKEKFRFYFVGSLIFATVLEKMKDERNYTYPSFRHRGHL